MTKGVEVILREGEGRERGRGLNYCQALPQPWRDNQERLPKKGPLCYLERASKSSHWGKGRGQRKEPGKETENNQQGRYQEIFKKQRKSEYCMSEATGKVMKLRADNVSEIKIE